MSKVLILRPQPAADQTAERARALGLEPVVAPMFTLRALEWDPPSPRDFDAVLVTSANAARLGGDGLTPFRHLPCYAVGGRSAAAARAAGFSALRIGTGNGSELLAMMAADGVRRAFHPCGRDFVPAAHPAVSIIRARVYASEAADRLPAEAERAIEQDAVVLLHSPRAAAIFAGLAGRLRTRVRIVVISPAAAVAAGPGWRSAEVAQVPRDQALLELAVKLCQTEPNRTRQAGE